MTEFKITFRRDVFKRWAIRSEDVRGLFLASSNYDALMRDLAEVLADLVLHNHGTDMRDRS